MIDKEKIDDYTLALMYLVLHKDAGGARAWKGFDWDVLDRLYTKGLISDPATKFKSVSVTVEGEKRMQQLFEKHFIIKPE